MLSAPDSPIDLITAVLFSTGPVNHPITAILRAWAWVRSGSRVD